MIKVMTNQQDYKEMEDFIAKFREENKDILENEKRQLQNQVNFIRYRCSQCLVKVGLPQENLLSCELYRFVLNDKTDFYDSNRAPFMNDNNIKRVKEIGNILNKIGGFDLMLEVAESMPKPDQRELEMCWDGIGDWKA